MLSVSPVLFDLQYGTVLVHVHVLECPPSRVSGLLSTNSDHREHRLVLAHTGYAHCGGRRAVDLSRIGIHDTVLYCSSTVRINRYGVHSTFTVLDLMFIDYM